MHSQVSAERQKRAFILESEGSRQSAINIAEGQKQSRILASEGDRMEKINLASGEADAAIARAKASATAIAMVSEAMAKHGHQAVTLMVAERYIDAFSQLAQKSTTMMLPAAAADPASIVATATSIFKRINNSSDFTPKP